MGSRPKFLKSKRKLFCGTLFNRLLKDILPDQIKKPVQELLQGPVGNGIVEDC
tara:strand:+ start:107297 stop:107455 length:159 start_codon:yes stop_codon:yes gene_type:complete